MIVMVGGTELFVDVSGAKLVPEGTRMAERESFVVLHGGPGLDHTYFKPWLDPLADIATSSSGVVDT